MSTRATTPLAPEIRVDPTVGGYRYVLPRRRLGKVGTIAGVIAVACAFAVVVPMGVIAVLVTGVLTGSSGWGSLLMPAVIGVFFLGLGLKVWRYAAGAAWGHAEIEVNAEGIRCVERVGPTRSARTIPGRSVRRLEMRAGSGKLGDKTATTGPMHNLGGIVALCGDDMTKRPVVVGYPGEMLVGLCESLAQEVGVESGIDFNAKLRPDDEEEDDEVAASASGGTPTIDLDDTSTIPQPAASAATVTRDGGALSIELPPLGLRKGGKGMFSFAILWNLIVWPMAIGMLAVGVKTGAIGAIIAGAFILLVFCGIGVFVAVEVIRMGRRRAIIDVVEGALLITTRTPFGSRQRQWAREEIASIKAGPSGTEVNEKPILELQVHARRPDGSRQKHGFLSERPDDELRWIAGELRAALAIGARARGGTVPDASRMDLSEPGNTDRPRETEPARTEDWP